jgi:hypothetical protein
LRQTVTTLDAASYTLYIRARRITGNTDLALYHADSATSNTTATTITGTLADYVVTVLGKAGGGTVYFGLQDRNGSGFPTQLEVTRWAVFQGTLNATQAAATYETVTDRQDATDWSGNSNTLQRGSTPGVDINDARLAEDGSTLRWSHTTDDYWPVAIADASTVSYVAVVEVDSCAAFRSILSKGDYDEWYLNTSCKPVFESTAGTVTATNALDTGKTYVVGVTVDGTSVSHFLSGVANGTGTLTTRTTGAGSDLLIGRVLGGNYFSGYIDLVGMNNTAIDHEATYVAIHDEYESVRGLTVE